MGVPGLYRWLVERYPKTIVDALETMPEFIAGTRVDPDTSQPNPNGVEFDNLYLDMNGIIHPACHPEDLPAPSSEEEMYLAIFKYIDRVFNIIRPRKVLYMAIDGVAPRAKMNQQRSRRYRSAKEIEDKREEEERMRNEWSLNGKKLPPKKPPTWDHNVITPGTPFMHRLSAFLRYYIHNRVTNDPGWKNVKVVLSDAGVPGEGEHKVMEFIRLQRAQPGYDPNTRHAIHGKDADLIMLSLATHEPRFSILRELDMHPTNRKMSAEQVKQDHEDEVAKMRLGEADSKGPAISTPPFKLIQINIMREYLDKEFRDVPFLFTYDLEQVIDDFVLMCFFGGNDFLPHLPSLDIHEGAISEMIKIYKDCVSTGRITGYLCNRGNCNLERCGVLLQELGKLEDNIFIRRKQKEEGMARARANRERDQKERDAAAKRNKEASKPAPVPQPKPAPKKEVKVEDKVKANKSAAAALKAQLLGTVVKEESVVPAVKKQKTERGAVVMDEDEEEREGFVDAAEEGVKEEEDAESDLLLDDDSIKQSNAEAAEEFLADLKKVMDEKRIVDQEDQVMLHESGWKHRYYMSKFGVDIQKDPAFPRQVVQHFMEGICWTLLYYYRGCPSWTWFYPHHFAPFASDFVGLNELSISFPAGTKPFKPFEQLMACLPPLSRHALPDKYQDLMVNPKSKIIDFYPKTFAVDMNGKKMSWMGVALLPFIDEKRLLDAVRPLEQHLSEQEKLQNSRGCDLLFVGSVDKHAQLADVLSSMTSDFPMEASDRTLMSSGEHINDNLFGTVAPWKGAPRLGARIESPTKRLDNITSNTCLCVRYEIPPFVEHVPQLLRGVDLPSPELSDLDAIIEGRKLLDGPPGGRGRGRGLGAQDQYQSTKHVTPVGGGLLGNTPMGRMLAAGLTGPTMGYGGAAGGGYGGGGAAAYGVGYRGAGDAYGGGAPQYGGGVAAAAGGYANQYPPQGGGYGGRPQAPGGYGPSAGVAYPPTTGGYGAAGAAPYGATGGGYGGVQAAYGGQQGGYGGQQGGYGGQQGGYGGQQGGYGGQQGGYGGQQGGGSLLRQLGGAGFVAGGTTSLLHQLGGQASPYAQQQQQQQQQGRQQYQQPGYDPLASNRYAPLRR